MGNVANSVATSQDGPVVQSLGKSKSRGKVPIIAPHVDSGRHVSQTGYEQAARKRIVIGCPAWVRCSYWRVILPTQAQTEAQLGIHLPVVLAEKEVFVRMVPRRRDVLVTLDGVGQSQQE